MSRGQRVQGRASHGLVYRNTRRGAMRARGQGPPWSSGGASICRLDLFVLYDQVVVGWLIHWGVLCSLCVKLGTMLQLCVRTLEGAELHVAHCSLYVGCTVSEASVDLQWQRPPQYGLLRSPVSPSGGVPRWPAELPGPIRRVA